MLEKINLEQKISQITNYWEPMIIAELNGQYVKIAKFFGEFIWHHHQFEDEMFYVLEGEFEMQFTDGSVLLRKNDMIVVPAGTEHRPVAHKPTTVLLFEPITTVKTGD